ncbi:MAG: carbon monoxide dehydrogenase [Alphaproteobacteria bacterium]|nr:carbon monoxide dehydrogenase [Alphaproteobacteria bacterium]
MKPVAFDYERPASLEDAIALLSGAGARVLAGGQSLGPMLNLRLAQPELLVDITYIPELKTAERQGDGLWLGACVTHAEIEDGAVPDVTNGALAFVAGGIAYRAVRNRGTVGGSLAHADPAADWVTCLSALGADAVIAGPSGERRVPVSEFLSGAFETALEVGEILRGVWIPTLSSAASWGYYKFCRKAGDFAEAIGAVLQDPERGIVRTVLGATNARPIVIDGAYGDESVRASIDSQGGDMDAYDRQVHFVTAKRAAMIAGVRVA